MATEHDRELMGEASLHARAKFRKDLTMNFRPCEGCTECCTLLGVTDLEPPKMRMLPCKHLSPDANDGKPGCAVYVNRPHSCSGFACAWKMPELSQMPEALRPDKCGIVCQVEVQDNVPAMVCYERKTGSWKSNLLFMNWFERCWESGINFVFIPAELGANRSFIAGKGQPIPDFIRNSATSVEARLQLARVTEAANRFIASEPWRKP